MPGAVQIELVAIQATVYQKLLDVNHLLNIVVKGQIMRSGFVPTPAKDAMVPVIVAAPVKLV